ncbi:MAG: redoxin domain-containing protein [Anaerolineae bacterium]
MDLATNSLRNLNQSIAPTSGGLAPDFSLLSIQGDMIQLKKYRNDKNIILWFSRGFTCPYCRGFMDEVITGYNKLVENNIEIIQVSPNLHQSAVNFFGKNPPPFPMICDPDKRLFRTYGIGDKGALVASQSMVKAFTTAAKRGEFIKTARAGAADVFDKRFLQRLHHHALTALNQAVIAIDLNGMIRHRVDVGTLEDIPSTPKMIQFLKPVNTN